jgi:uncharacterized protein
VRTRLPVTLLLAAALLPAESANTTLADAAMKADWPAVRELLNQKAPIDTTLPDGTSALHWAVRTNAGEIVDLLLRAGADVRAADRYGLTPLYLACANADTAMIKKLLDAGADPNFATPAGETPLMTLLRTADNNEAMRALLSHGAQVNAKDKNAEQTALMVAVRENRAEAVQLLLNKDAETNARTRIGKAPARRPPGAGGGSHGTGIVRSGWPDRGFQDATPGGLTALLYAARDGRIEIARTLVAGGANVNLAEANKMSPLLMAIANGHIDVANFLIDKGADLNAADFWGRTPLWTAVEMRNLDIDKSGQTVPDRTGNLALIKLLLDKGANPNPRTAEVPPTRRWIMTLGDLSWVDFTGQTPFLRAALSGDVTVMRLLLDHGADPTIPTFSGTTPLMAAAGVNWVVAQTYTEPEASTLEALELCLQKGADVNAANSMGVTAVMGAANRGSNGVIEFLAKHGARLDVKDKEGRTPLVWAEGVFLATNAPERKPATIALLQKLLAGTPQ